MKNLFFKISPPLTLLLLVFTSSCATVSKKELLKLNALKLNTGMTGAEVLATMEMAPTTREVAGPQEIWRFTAPFNDVVKKAVHSILTFHNGRLIVIQSDETFGTISYKNGWFPILPPQRAPDTVIEWRNR